MQNISLPHLFLFEIKPILGFCEQSGNTHFLLNPSQCLVSMNLYQQAKNEAISSFCSRDTKSILTRISEISPDFSDFSKI